MEVRGKFRRGVEFVQLLCAGKGKKCRGRKVWPTELPPLNRGWVAGVVRLRELMGKKKNVPNRYGNLQIAWKEGGVRTWREVWVP